MTDIFRSGAPRQPQRRGKAGLLHLVSPQGVAIESIAGRHQVTCLARLDVAHCHARGVCVAFRHTFRIVAALSEFAAVGSTPTLTMPQVPSEIVRAGVARDEGRGLPDGRLARHRHHGRTRVRAVIVNIITVQVAMMTVSIFARRAVAVLDPAWQLPSIVESYSSATVNETTVAQKDKLVTLQDSSKDTDLWQNKKYLQGSTCSFRQC